MKLSEVTAVRDRRLHGTRAAALVGLMGRRSGVSVDNVSWEALVTLPSWCLNPVAEQQRLQSVCGAIYMKPLIISSIDGNFLRSIRAAVGQSVFDGIRNDDSLEIDWDTSQITAHTEEAVMKWGASVLLATLTDSSLRRLFERSLGDFEAAVNAETARVILNHANTLVAKESVADASAAST